MTGEISLRGRVLPVGGVKEKVLAALAAGIKTVLLPARNMEDLVELPDAARAKLEFVSLERVEDALDLALEAGTAPGAGMIGILLGMLGAVSALSGTAGSSQLLSLSEVQIRGRSVRVELRVQVLSLGEVIDSTAISTAMRRTVRSPASAVAILDYVHEHYRLMAGPIADSGALDPSERLAILSGAVSEGPLALDPMNEVSEWVDVVLEYEVAELGEFEALGVAVDLFAETSPGHSDSAAVTWNGVELGPWMFNAAASGHLFAATDEMLARTPRPAAASCAEVLPTPSSDGLALLAVLLVVGARRASSSALISCGLLALAVAGGTAFGHHVPPRFEIAGFAGLGGTLALAYLALDDLVHREGRTRLLEPLVFGAVAGVGISAQLAPDVATELQQYGARAGAALGSASR